MPPTPTQIMDLIIHTYIGPHTHIHTCTATPIPTLPIEHADNILCACTRFSAPTRACASCVGAEHQPMHELLRCSPAWQRADTKMLGEWNVKNAYQPPTKSSLVARRAVVHTHRHLHTRVCAVCAMHARVCGERLPGLPGSAVCNCVDVYYYTLTPGPQLCWIQLVGSSPAIT